MRFWNRSALPSGDQIGDADVDPSVAVVNSRSSLPSALTTHTCGPVRSLLVKAIRRPSGDHAALAAPTSGVTSSWSPLPSALARNSVLGVSSGFAIGAAANATVLPSGDTSAACGQSATVRPGGVSWTD